MNNKIVILCFGLALSTTNLFANFDNFTNWGDTPTATEATGENISPEALASFTSFEVGRKNGAPASISTPMVQGEFFTLESDKSEIVVASAVEFPQRLMPNQVLKIVLGKRPELSGVAINFGVVSEKLHRNNYMTYRFEDAERPLSIRINGTTIYHRALSDGRVEQEVFLPFYCFNDEVNYLEIKNEGKHIIAFDYFRIQPASEGRRVFAAFAPHKDMSIPLLKASAIELIELSLPANSLTNAVFMGNASAPLNLEAAYVAMNDFFSLGYVHGIKYGSEFNKWASILSNVLKRKKLPYVRIKGDLTKADEKTAMWFLTRFGNIVAGWICDDESSANILSKYIDGVNIVAIDVRDSGKVMTAANAANSFTRVYSSPLTVKGGRADRTYGDYMQHYLVAGKNFSPSFIPYLYPMKPLPNQQTLIDNAEEGITALLQIIMHGGRGALIEPGDNENFVILPGKQQPIVKVYEKLFEFAKGDAALLPMSLCLEQYNVGSPLEDCYYVATRNAETEITVVVLAGRKDLGRAVRAVVPVGWNGAAVIEQQDFQIDEIGQNPPVPLKPTKKNVKILAPAKKKGVDIGQFKGVVSHQFQTAGLSIIKITKYSPSVKQGKKPAPAKNESSVEKPKKAQILPERPTNWRCVPYVSATNFVDMQSFVTNRIKSTGSKGIGVIKARPSKIESLKCVAAPEALDMKGASFIMRNAPLWDDNSIVLEFAGMKRTQRPAYIFNLGAEEYLKGSMGFLFYAYAKPIVNSVSERLALSSDSVKFSIGSKTNRVYVDIPIETPTIIFVPYEDIMGVMKDPSIVNIAMDTKEARDIELEINSLSAVYKNTESVPTIATRYDLYEKALYMLVEGETGKPLDIVFRMKDKYTLTKASPIMPHGFTKLKLDMDVERNKYSISIEKLPNNDGKRGDVSKYFPAIIGEAPQGRSRVLIKFAAER